MQTEFKTYSEAYLIGQVADASLKQIDSYVAEEAINFGSAVKRGTNKDKNVQVCTGSDFLGIALRDDICMDIKYPKGRIVSVLTKGRVVVRVTEGVEAGDIAYLHSDGSFSKTEIWEPVIDEDDESDSDDDEESDNDDENNDEEGNDEDNEEDNNAEDGGDNDEAVVVEEINEEGGDNVAELVAEGVRGVAIGIFVRTQSQENSLTILEIK